MPYTLKLDWSQQRIAAVIRALSGGTSVRVVDAARNDIALSSSSDARPEEITTLKFSWPEKQLDAVCSALEYTLARLEEDALRARDSLSGPSYDEVVSDQAQVHAALREIREYRACVAEVKKEIRKAGKQK